MTQVDAPVAAQTVLRRATAASGSAAGGCLFSRRYAIERMNHADVVEMSEVVVGLVIPVRMLGFANASDRTVLREQPGPASQQETCYEHPAEHHDGNDHSSTSPPAHLNVSTQVVVTGRRDQSTKDTHATQKARGVPA